MKRRASGILLHITSLPSKFGIGDLGLEAYKFVDFLAQSDQSYWQILPLNPTEVSHYNSPYQSISAFAFNPLLLSIELLVEDGLLKRRDLEPVPEFSEERVNYPTVTQYKSRLIHLAYDRFQGKKDPDFERFCEEQAFWLNDFALFSSLKTHFQGRVWIDWPSEVRFRDPNALCAAAKELSAVVARVKFTQYLFFRQWRSLKKYCQEKEVQIIGDIPIYVEYDSADLWSHPELFKLDDNLRPYAVAGVPPDYFSATGQLWGNPVYQWDVLGEKRYAWWRDRVTHNLRLFDVVRIDHFRGLVAYWEVPAGETTATNGRWVEAPVMDFLRHLQKHFPSLPIIAEDLGVITPDVREVMSTFEFPGMRILMFAFGGNVGTHPYIPHNLDRNCIAYTGTHDNNTIRGWIDGEASEEEKAQLFRYLGRKVPVTALHWEMIRLLMMSAANTVMVPAQDILGLGGDARMNLPASVGKNWEWRLRHGQLTDDVGQRLKEMTETYGRA